MEGKGVRVPLGIWLMVVLILGLNLAQTQVEARTCCRNQEARSCYTSCRVNGGTQQACAQPCNCVTAATGNCPPGYPYGHGHFCKLGCASSMCSTISTLQNYDVVEKAVVDCNNKCSELCNEDYNEGYNAIFTG